MNINGAQSQSAAMKANRVRFLSRVLFILLAGTTCGLAQLAPQVVQQMVALDQEKDGRTPAQKKMDSQLIYAGNKAKTGVASAAAPDLQPDVKIRADGRVLVDITATVSDELLGFIAKVGGQVVNSFAKYDAIRAWVPVDKIEDLAGRLEVRFVDRAHEATTNTGSVNGEGDTCHRAAAARAAHGVNGAGVRVGALSDSVDYLAAAQALGDLGTVGIIPGQAGSGSGEGTAMLEIIHDLAPGAALYFATAFSGAASFAANIDALVASNCTVIVDDVTYFYESPFQDGQPIAQAVKRASDAGVLFFSSARNSGSKDSGTSGTWEGDFTDGGAAGAPLPAGRLHNFGGGTNYDVVTLRSSARADLFWADPLGGSSNDYDLYVLNSTGTSILRLSTTSQTGTQDPYESVSTLYVGERIVILQKTGAAGRFLHLDTGRCRLAISTPGNVRGHNCANADNAFSVAAVDVHTTSPFPSAFTGGASNPLESFSSDGPRRLFFHPNGTPITPGNFSSTGGTVIQKPDIAAADGASGSAAVPGFNPFYGTSAAAPHAAAIAALWKSFDPGMSAAQIRAALYGAALDIGPSGVDRNAGYGLIMADLGLPNLDYWRPEFWSAGLTPRMTPDATSSYCALPTVLTGNVNSTYLNWSCVNNGVVVANDVRTRVYLDDDYSAWGVIGGLNPSGVATWINVGTLNVRGGRHTLKMWYDWDGVIAESDETDNQWEFQYVWSPYSLTNDTPVWRNPPPAKGYDTYPNCDGFSANLGSGQWWCGVGILPYDAADDFDLCLYQDYVGSSDGFDTTWVTSGYGSGGSDFVIANRNKTGTLGPYYPGAIRWLGNANGFYLQQANSGTGLEIGDTWNGVFTNHANDVLNMHEVYLPAAGLWSVELDNLSGSANLGLTMYDAAGSYFSKSSFMPGAWADVSGAGGDESFIVTATNSGWYGIAVWKRGSTDLGLANTYRLRVTQPTVTVAATDATAGEPATGQGGGTFTFNRLGSTTAALMVNFGVGGTATSGGDYTALGTTVSFAAGSATATKTVSVLDDTIVESPESVLVTLAPGTGYVVGTPSLAGVTILDDDSTVTVAATDPTAGEPGTGQGSGTFTFTRVGFTNGALTVNFSVGGTASSGGDYTSIGTTALFAAGAATATKTVSVLNDVLVESNETVVLTLAGGTGYIVGSPPSATVTIRDDDGSDVIVDNADGASRVTVVGAWTTSTYTPGYWAANYLHDGAADKGTKSVTFRPNLPSNGFYAVYLWWPAQGASYAWASNTPVDICSSTATNTVVVNQKVNGNAWFLLGTNTLTAGTNGWLRIRTDGTSGYVVADAARFVWVGAAPVPVLAVAPLGLTNSCLAGTIAPSQTFEVWNAGGGTLSYAVTDTVAWLSCSPTSGTSTGEHDVVGVNYATAGLGTGTYSGAIFVSGAATTKTVQVTLTVTAPSGPGGEIAILDSIAPVNDLNMPFGDGALGAPRVEHLTITNTDSIRNLTVRGLGFPAYMEDFNDGLAQGWVGDTGATWAVVGGAYRASSLGSEFMGAKYADRQWGDASVSVRCRPENSDSDTEGLTLRTSLDFVQGVYAGPSGVGSAYMFGIAIITNSSGGFYGEYEVWRQVAGNTQPLQAWSYSPVIRQGENVLLASAEGSILKFFINGTLVWSGLDTNLVVGHVGLLGHTGPTWPHAYDFDDVIVSDPVAGGLLGTAQRWYNAYPAQGGPVASALPIGRAPVYPGKDEAPAELGADVGLSSLVSGAFRLQNVPALPCTLLPGQAVTCDVVFQPTVVGSTGATVVVQSDDWTDPTLAVPLSGNGIGGAVQVIVDNTNTPNVTLVGAWTTSTYAPGYWAANYLHDGSSGKGTKSVTFRPNLPTNGNYDVYMRWPTQQAAYAWASNAPVDIVGSGASNTVVVNQKVNGGQWVLIGSNMFAAGTGGTVRVRTDGTVGYVIADAVKFVRRASLPPVNDNWANTIPLPLPSTTTGDNIGATTEAGEQQLVQAGATVWWYTLAPESGTLTIDTFGSSFDTMLHIYTGWEGGFTNLVPVTDNDDAGGGLQSEVTFAVNAGQYYEIRVAGFLGSQGAIRLNVGSVVPPLVDPIIVDNADGARVTVAGAWTTSTWAPGYWPTNYLHDGSAGKGTKSVTFRPSLPVSGSYEVSMWWPTQQTTYAWASNTPVDLVSGSVTNTVRVNQKVNGNRWFVLGTNTFAAGSNGSVRVRTDGTSGYVIADAVRFVKVGTTPPPSPVIAVTPASLSFGTVTVGTTSTLTFVVQNVGGGTLGGSASVASPFSITAGGGYSLGAGASQTVAVSYSPLAAGTNSATVSFTGGGGATRAVIGVGVNPVSVEVIVDNTNTPNVTVAGAWTTSTWAPGYYRANYLHDGNAGKGTKSVTFRPVLPVSGSYEVYLWWPTQQTAYAWASNVPVDFSDASGTNTVFVNQKLSGGQWTLVAVNTFAAGTSGWVRVRTTGTDGYVIADAVRFVKAASMGSALGRVDEAQGYWPVVYTGDGQAEDVEARALVDGDTNTIWTGSGESPWQVMLDLGCVTEVSDLGLLYADELWVNQGMVGAAELDHWFDLGAVTNWPVAVRYIYLNLWDDSGTNVPALREIIWRGK